ncbi:MAG: methyltransferase regulatory domain-containing protein [Leclercia sp.]
MYLSSCRITSHIGAMAAVYGVPTSLPAQARVLELGCGNAESLITQALAWPESHCTGIDLEPQSILKAEEYRKQRGAKNVSLYALGLRELVKSQLGEFDYIIITGLFSLLPEQERAVLLNFCERNLSSAGIVALQWNCLPGSRDAKTLQDAIALHTIDAPNEHAVLDSARAMLIYLEMAQQAGSTNKIIDHASNMSESEFMLRYLNDFNDAVYLVDFNQQITENGFQYVGDLRANSELAAWYGESLSKVHDAIVPGKSKVLAQQYLDFAVNRTERFSLLVAKSRLSKINDKPCITAINDLHWAGCFKRFFSNNQEVGNAHINKNKLSFPSKDPLTLSILDIIGDAWPLSVSTEQIIQHTLMPEDPEGHRENVLAALEILFSESYEGLLFSYGPSPYNLQHERHLLPIPGLRDDVKSNDEVIRFNLWGEPIALNTEEYTFLHNGVNIIDDYTANLFLTLRDKGAIGGSAYAWREAFQACLTFVDETKVSQLVMPLLMFSFSTDIGGFLTDVVAVEKKAKKTSAAKHKKNDVLLKKASILLHKGKNQEARAFLENIHHQYPENIQILEGLVRAYLLTSSYDNAQQKIAQLLARHPSHWDFYHLLANIYYKTGVFFYAGRIIRIILRNDLENAQAWDILGCLYREHGNADFALTCAKKTVNLEPSNPYFLNNLGHMLSEKQQMKEAVKYLKKAVEISNNNFELYGTYLFVLTHDPDISPQDLYHAHVQYGNAVDVWAQQIGVMKSWKGSRDPDRKLRIGFVSGDFLRHPVSNFLMPFWDGIDRQQFELIGYHSCPKRDEITDHFESTALLWRDIVKSSDVELANQIHEDAIDILIDLSGHTTYCRLPVFGLHPAPVQMTWIGYPGTTGMKTMDYRMLPDTFRNAPNLQEQFTEQILYVSMDKTFEPNPECPEVSVLPALENGYITFGSFNRPKKINEDVLKLWAAILTRIPMAKMLIGFMNDKGIVNWITQFMLDNGVNEEQLVFRSQMPMEEYLAEHKHIDIMLDAFPYSGGTTTNHAAWMGVPTISLKGITLSGCQTMDTMYTYGLEQFIAVDAVDYINKALYWSGNIEELSAIRMGMRDKIPTKHTSGFNVAATFEKALRTAWGLYCSGEAPQSFVVKK